jgi:hypothetical protein
MRSFLSRLIRAACRSAQGIRPRFRPRLEALEGRWLPTVTTNLDLATGLLTITGSAGDNAITVTERTGAPGGYNVAAADGVSGSIVFGGVRNIVIDLQGQATAAGDTVDLVGNAGTTTFLPGGLSITGAGGVRVGLQDNFNVSGAVSVTKTAGPGGLTVKTGATGSATVAQTNVSLGATTITNNGTGSTTVNLQGVSANDIAVRGTLSVTTLSATATVTVVNAAIAGGLLQSGAGPTTGVLLQTTTVGGFVSLNGTASNSAVNASISQVTIGTFFSVASGNGSDQIDFNVSSVLGLGLLPKQQTFGVNLKGGTNTSDIGTSGAFPQNVIHGSLFHFGAGTERFNLQNYTVTSFVTVNARAGNVGLTANITNTNISGFLSCAAVNNTDDHVTVDNLSIGQNFALDLGGGDNSTTITNNHYLGSYSEIDTGFDLVKFTGNTGFGDVTITAGRIFIGSNNFLNDQIAGNASFTSNAEFDTIINLGPQPGVAVDASNAVSIGRALTIRLNNRTVGGDRVGLNNVSIQTDLTISATPTLGEEIFEMTNAKIGGNLSIDAAASTASVPISMGTSGTSNTGAVVVLGNLAIATGSALDRIILADLTVGGTTVVTTNAGGDSVNIEAFVGSVPGPSQFFGAVTVATGADADTINLGHDATNQARFYAAVTFDGGAGTDTLTETAPQYLGVSPTTQNIP